MGSSFSRKREDVLVKMALDSSAAFTALLVTLSVIIAVRTSVAMTSRPVLMNLEKLFCLNNFIMVPCRTDWYNILVKISFYVFA